MRLLFLLVFFSLTISAAQAQSIAQDSLSSIERQRKELRDEQARLKAKQDSLMKERIRIEQQQVLLKQQELQKQQELYTQQQKLVYTYQQSLPVATERKREVKNIIGLAPVHVFITGIEIFYERAVSKTASLQLNAGYHSMERYPSLNSNGTVNTSNSNNSTNIGALYLPDNDGKVAYSGVRLQVQYKSYIFQEAGVLRKLHIGPSLLYKHDEITIMTNYVSNAYASIPYSPVYKQYYAEALSGAVDVGYNIKCLRYFSIDPFVGFVYTVPLTSKQDAAQVNVDFLNPYKQGLLLRTGLTLGYMF